jgi:hypothetical protein
MGGSHSVVVADSILQRHGHRWMRVFPTFRRNTVLMPSSSRDKQNKERNISHDRNPNVAVLFPSTILTPSELSLKRGRDIQTAYDTSKQLNFCGYSDKHLR